MKELNNTHNSQNDQNEETSNSEEYQGNGAVEQGFHYHHAAAHHHEASDETEAWEEDSDEDIDCEVQKFFQKEAKKAINSLNTNHPDFILHSQRDCECCHGLINRCRDINCPNTLCKKLTVCKCIYPEYEDLY